MLTSHEKWSTLSGETLTTWRPQNGEAQEVINLFWISHNRARFEMPNSDTVLRPSDPNMNLGERRV